MAYHFPMHFLETTVFARRAKALLSEEEYRSLQVALLLRPEQGNLIKGSGGLRKIRWGSRERGRRGGLRVIYHWDKAGERFFMLFIYRKSETGDLTPVQVKVLRRVVEEELP
jgi:mRNA-degrading endonuclease RelE of RelBE toxin-antitoxin system